MVWETQKGGDRMTTSKSISIPAVTHAMLQELSDKNRKKPDQYLQELIKREYDKKKWTTCLHQVNPYAGQEDWGDEGVHRRNRNS